MLGQAGRLALTGEDPGPARPEPLGPQWADRAREVVQALIDGRAEEVHARATAQVRDLLSAGQLDKAWWRRTRGAGPAGPITVRCHAQPGQAVIADVTVGFPRGPVALRIGFLMSGEVAGLKLIPPASADGSA